MIAGAVVSPFPVYAMRSLPGDRIVIAGGGGTLKSGIPNGLRVYSFSGSAFTETAALALHDVVFSIDAHPTTPTMFLCAGRTIRALALEPDAPLSETSHTTLHTPPCALAATATRRSPTTPADSPSRVLVCDEAGPVEVKSWPDASHAVASFTEHTKAVNDIDLLPHPTPHAPRDPGSWAVTSGRDRRCFVWDTTTGALVTELPSTDLRARYGRGAHIRCCKFLPDPRRSRTVTIALGETTPRHGGFVSLWQSPDPAASSSTAAAAAPWRMVTRVRAVRDPVSALAVAESGGLVAAASAEGHVVVFRVGREGRRLDMVWGSEGKVRGGLHKLPATALAFSGDGQWVFSGSADSTVVAVPAVCEAGTAAWVVLAILALVLAFVMGLVHDL